MGTATNIKIGTCSITFKGTDLGHTMGGATFSYTPEYADILADQYGNTPLDKALVGEVVTITARLAESTIANFAVAIPAGTVAGATSGRVTLGKDAGYRLSANAGALIVHPLVNASSNKDDDIVLYKAVVHEAVEVNYSNDEETVLEVTFIGLIDTTKSSGSLLGLIGDSAD